MGNQQWECKEQWSSENKGRIAVVTDSNSGICQDNTDGIYVIPMPISMNGVTYYEGVDLSQEEFYTKLTADEEVLTSTPVAGEVIHCFESLLQWYEEVLYLPMSSTLSSSCQNAMMLAQEFDGKVQVIDGRRISVPQKQMVYDIKMLVECGWDAKQIKETMERQALDSVIFIAVDTLKYLKKGGRITKATAMIGEMLHIKPILRIQGGVLDIYKKARTMKSAKALMLEAIQKECEDTLGITPEEAHFEVAYSGVDSTEAKEMKKKLESMYPQREVIMDPLTWSIACHTGPNALGIACTKVI